MSIALKNDVQLTYLFRGKDNNKISYDTVCDHRAQCVYSVHIHVEMSIATRKQSPLI